MNVKSAVGGAFTVTGTAAVVAAPSASVTWRRTVLAPAVANDAAWGRLPVASSKAPSLSKSQA